MTRLTDAGREVIIEECLVGEEVSVLAITDGTSVLVLEPAMDHKQVGEGDTPWFTDGFIAARKRYVFARKP